MSKGLRTAALIVGGVALIATGIGAAAALGAFGTVAAGSATAATLATIATVATVASVAAGVLSVAAVLLASKPKSSLGGSATKFTIDKESGIPYQMGRTGSGGRVVHRQYYGPKNAYESWATVHSLGPIKSLGPLLIDNAEVTFSGGAAMGRYADYMWLTEQLGACPESVAMAGPFGSFPGWDSTAKISGLAADLWTLKFDTNGKKYPAGIPQRLRVNEGVYVYDPRRDSTYPGGAGACRIGQEDTYVWSENPALHAITWAYGRYQNGVLVAGGGLEVDGIMMAPFVEWANVCEANNWKVGGTIYTTSDDGWDVLKMIAQAGGGEVFPCGALLSCVFSAPRVSIGTITAEDLAGDLDIPSSASIRQRRNTIIPRVRLESHGWEMTPLEPVTVTDYVTVDGGSRPREISYPLVQDKDQGAELATYDMLNMREIDGISIPAKVYAIGYLPGDCVTLDIPEANLVARDVIIRQREIDATSLVIGLTCRTETPGKHDYALGKTGVAPPTPDLSIPNIGDLPAPDAGDWALTGTTLTEGGVSIAALVVTGSVGNANAEAVLFELLPAGSSTWRSVSLDAATVTRKEITGVTPLTDYYVGVRYRVRGVLGDRLVLGPVTSGESTGSINGLSIAISPGALTIPCDADGTPKSGALPVTAQIIFYDGDTDIHETATYSIATTGCDATVNSTGLVTITDITVTPASAVVTASVGSRVMKQAVTISTPRDGATGGAGASPYGAVPINSTGVTMYTPIVIANTGQTVTYQGNVHFAAAGGPTGCSLLAEYSLDGSDWSQPWTAGTWSAATTSNIPSGEDETLVWSATIANPGGDGQGVWLRVTVTDTGGGGAVGLYPDSKSYASVS